MIFDALGTLALGEVPASPAIYGGGSGGSTRRAKKSVVPVERIQIHVTVPGRRSVPAVQIRTTGQTNPLLPSPHRPRADTGDQPEMLEGTVQGLKASAPEERLAKALSKLPSVDGYEFRQTLGAPRGLPGWFEIDFVVSARGMVYAIEVDSEFTHKQKSGRSDVLHDAKALKQLAGQGHQVYPSVIHLDMETDLVDQKWAERTAKRLFQ